MVKLADFCFRHRWFVIAIWCVLLAAAFSIGWFVPISYQADYQTPGAEATKAFDLLDKHFPGRKGDSIYVVFSAAKTLPSKKIKTSIESKLIQIRDFPHIASVISPFDPDGSRQWSQDKTTAFAVVNLDRTIDKLANIDPDYQRKFLDMLQPGLKDGLQVEVTSFVSSEALGNESLALGFAAIVLLIAFGSVLATGIPIVTALFGLGIGSVSGICLTHIIETPDWAATVSTMIGLGVGIDYALFILTRYRKALASGLDAREAVLTAMATAGRSVLFAGGVVVLSLFGMVTMQLGYMDGVMTASITTVFTMLAASLTLLPAVLSIVRENIDRFHIPFALASDTKNGRGVWYRWSRTVQKRPWVAFTTGIIVITILSLPLLGFRLGLPDDGNRPETETSRRAYDLLTKAFGPGFNGPVLIVIEASKGILPANIMVGALKKLQSIEGVAFVVPTPSPSLNAAIVNVYPTTSPQSEETEKLVEKLRKEFIPNILEGTELNAVVGGFTAISMDQAKYVMLRLPWFIGSVIFLSFLLLTIVFRSPIVALKAAVMNLLSIASAYGIVAYAVNGTWLGRLLRIPATPVPAFVPMIMFAVLFGLSMDYEVFLLSRIREEYEKTHDNSTAVADGLAATARVITTAAAIMVFVFGVFIFDPNVFIKQIGLGLTVAILVDATLIRIIIVPAAMDLLGNANWWTPKLLNRVFLVIKLR